MKRFDFESYLMQEIENYLERGRLFHVLTTTQLANRWVTSFRAWCTSDFDGDTAELKDIAAELRLRGMEPPYEKVLDERKAMVEKIARDGPHNPGVPARIAKFREDPKKPRN